MSEGVGISIFLPYKTIIKEIKISLFIDKNDLTINLNYLFNILNFIYISFSV